jgi:hypothetical protein
VPPACSRGAGLGTTEGRSPTPGNEDRGAAAVTGVDSLGITVGEVMSESVDGTPAASR